MNRKFIAILQDKQKGSLTNDLLEQHVAHLRNLRESGSLFLCGPFKDDDGAIQILLADSYYKAEALVLSDPFIVNKYYQRYTLQELVEANEENNYLLEDVQTGGNLVK